MSIFKNSEGKEHTGEYVAYLRVSTEDQDCDRQIHVIKKYLNGGDYKLTTFTEKPMSGATDPHKREQLTKAVEYCRKHKATLVFGDLERFCNDPTISEDPMRLQMKALFSEWERQRISERTKDKLDEYQTQIKEKGYFISKQGKKIKKLGTHSKMAKAHIKAGEQVSDDADIFSKSIYYYINDAYTNCGTLSEMAEYLNDRDVETPRGGTWYPSSVRNQLKRLKIGDYDDQ